MKIFTLCSFSNKKLFYISLSISIIAFLLISLSKEIESVCYYSGCYDFFSLIFLFSILFYSFLFYSFIFLFQKNKLRFEKWRKFSFIFLLINTIVIIITPEYWGDEILNIQRSVVVLLLTALHFIISLFYLFKKVK